MLSPVADFLPQARRWEPRDAALRWSAEPEGGDGLLGMYRGVGGTRLVVQGFGRRLAAARPSEAGIVARLLQARPQPRAPPSGADPEAVVGPGVRTEDDVLHCPNERLPSFGSRLGPSDAELLCQFLTVPYLRIPMLVDFLREDARLRALESPELQAVVDACLFEPGAWRPCVAQPLPETIPSADPALRATPCGLLVNELVHSPLPLLQGLQDMLEKAFDFDTGAYGGPSAQAVLYVIRLAVRVEEYASIVAESMQPRGERSEPVRCWDCIEALVDFAGAWPADVAERVRDGRGRLVGLLRKRGLAMLEGWRGRLMKAEQLGEACEVLVHMALVFRNAEAQADVSSGFDDAAVRTILTCQLFLTNNFAFELEAGAEGEQRGAGLRPRNDRVDFFFDLIQKHRRRILDWIEEAPSRKAGAVLEDVIAALTMDAKLTRSSGCEEPRRWSSLVGPDCRGRLCPDTEMDGYLTTFENATENEGEFERWLQMTTRAAVGTEINLQLGTFTMQSNERELLDSRLTEPTDFAMVIGLNSSHRLQCTKILKTEQCEQVKLMFRHDLHYWEADSRTPKVAFSRFCVALPDWVNEGVSRLPKSICPAGLMFEDLSGEVVRAQIQRDKALLEVVFFKSMQGTQVNIFKVVSFGRRFLRTILFSSSPTHCFCDLSPALVEFKDKTYEIQCGLENLDISEDTSVGKGLVITRALSKEMGNQVFVPRRYLDGLLPEVLLGKLFLSSFRLTLG
jgi:hypothetical protein